MSGNDEIRIHLINDSQETCNGKEEVKKQITEEEFLFKLNRLKEATAELDARIKSGVPCWRD